MIALTREVRVVLRRGPMRLLRYEPRGPVRPRPVILVPSIINRATILDLGPGQSLAAHLVESGLDVYLIDWGQPGPGDAHLGLEDYERVLLGAALRAVLRQSGAGSAHLLGYCLGGTMSLLAAARDPQRVATVCALTTPVDLARPGALGVLTDDRLIDLERLTRAWPIVPGPALWLAFQALDPVGVARKWRGWWRRRRDGGFRTRFAAQERWLADPVPVTARALRDIVLLYRTNALVRESLLSSGRAPVLNLIAESDTIVPPAASKALTDHWGGPVETRTFRGGHIGITVGSRAPSHMWAAATTWLHDHQGVGREPSLRGPDSRTHTESA